MTAPVPPLIVPTKVEPVDADSCGNVQLVNVPLEGVPSIGVTKVGDVFNTTLPVPVLVVTPVPPLATGSVPVMPVVKGSPVTLVATNAAGVPRPIALPEASSQTPFEEGYTIKTSLVPAGNDTEALALDDDKGVAALAIVVVARV